MTASIPATEPEKAIAGDTWQWTRSLADYPASTWSLAYHFANASHRFAVTTSADGDGFAVTVAAATTAAIMPGTYDGRAYATAGTQRFEVWRGQLVVEQDFAKAGAGYDGRSHARKALDAIEAVIEGRATKDQESYSIEGRSLSRTPLADLMAFRNQYRAEVHREENAERVRRGLGSRSTIKVRFGG